MEGVKITEDNFGFIKSDSSEAKQKVKRFTISNRDMCIKLISYGATITSLKIPSKDGKFRDIVLGFDDIEGYLKDTHYFGCTIGRFANRISKGRFKIDKKEYQLNTNDKDNHLHGGLLGFDKVLWESQIDTDANAVIFTYSSPSGDEHYPGQVNCKVIYELEESKLIIKYEATASDDTPINLTNHSYFNLGGHNSGPILNHTLAIRADHYTPVNENDIPTGQISKVKNTPYDFRKQRNIGKFLSEYPDGLDTNFCINGKHGNLRIVGRLSDSNSGCGFEILSTQPGIQVYTANELPTVNSLKGKDGSYYKKFGGICLESQNYPDAMNHENFPSCIIGEGDVYSQTTIYHFFVEQDLLF